MSTRAISYLKQKKIPFRIVKYQHAEKGAAFAAQATGYPLARTVKTLVVGLATGRYCLALLPGDKELNLKKLAVACRVKRAAMADQATAERLTGYLVGGISPMATRQKLPVIMEAGILDTDQIVINAGQRGVMIEMAPNDIVTALGCKVAAIADDA